MICAFGIGYSLTYFLVVIVPLALDGLARALSCRFVKGGLSAILR
jgi:hypothetical protein